MPIDFDQKEEELVAVLSDLVDQQVRTISKQALELIEQYSVWRLGEDRGSKSVAFQDLIKLSEKINKSLEEMERELQKRELGIKMH